MEQPIRHGRAARGWLVTPRVGVAVGVLVAAFVLLPADGSVEARVQTAEVSEALLELFTRAEQLFQMGEPAQELLTELIDRIDQLNPGEISEEHRDLLAKSLSYRAISRLDFGENDAADADLRRLVQTDPRFDFDRTLESPVLLERFDGLRQELIGYVSFQVEPPDAEVRLGGGVIDVTEPVPLLADSYSVTVERVGFAGQAGMLDVEAGDTFQYDIVLNRVSTVLYIQTDPPGATVFVNTYDYGQTTGDTTDGVSDPLVIPNIEPGVIQLDVTLDDYRPERLVLTLGAVDYRGRIDLQPTQGTVRLNGLVEGSEVLVTREGEDQTEALPESDGRLVLPAGNHTVTVVHPTRGQFEDVITVLDGEEHLVDIQMSPTVALVGLLGESAIHAELLLGRLREAFLPLDQWRLLDRAEAGSAVLEELGLTSERLRSRASPLRVHSSEDIPWTEVQQAMDRNTSGSVYLLCVLAEGVAPRYVDVWIWRSAPGSARPARLRASLAQGDRFPIESAISSGFGAVSLDGPWWGALLVDTDVEPGVLVATVTAQGPADEAGFEPGDVIRAVDGTAVEDVVDVTTRFGAAAPGSTLSVDIARRGVEDSLSMAIGSGPVVLRPHVPGLAYPAISAALAALEDTITGTPALSVSRLNDAAAVLEVGDVGGALERLLRIQASVIGEGVVPRADINYWLGLAYLRAGARSEALRAFQRASDPEARLFHNDGPWAAPRARARLAELAGAVP